MSGEATWASNSYDCRSTTTGETGYSDTHCACNGLEQGPARLVGCNAVGGWRHFTGSTNQRPLVSRGTVREDRFRQLFDDHWLEVVRFAARRSSTVDPEDVAAAVFAIVWQRLDDVPAGAERAWLLTTTRHTLNNQWRSQRRTIAQAEVDAPPQAPDQQSELLVDVATALQLLSDADREVIALAFWDELDATEAGAVLGCTATAYRVRLHRARRRLRAAMRRAPRFVHTHSQTGVSSTNRPRPGSTQ